MPGQDVDDTALGVDRKGDLRSDEPVGPFLEASGNLLVERGVASIEESIQVSASPARNEIDSHVERFRDRADARQPHLVQVAALDPRDRPSRYAGELRHVLLGQALSDSNRSDRSPESKVIHRDNLAQAAHLPVIYGSRGG